MFGGLRDVKDVVDDLERQPGSPAKPGQGFQLGFTGSGAEAPEANAGGEQRRRLAEMDEAELFQGATIQPAADFDSLEIVFVITDFEPIDKEIFTTTEQ